MKTETITIYRCDHCSKIYQIKHYAEKHEKSCTKNPDNRRPCFGCDNLKMKKTTLHSDSYAGAYDYEVEILFCQKVNSFLYPPKVEHKKNWYETDPVSNKPMPRECEFHTYEELDFDEIFKE